MNEKNPFKIKDEKFTIFIPLINLLLFDTLNSPDFSSGYQQLSQNFMKVINSNEKVILEKNEFFKLRVFHFLSNLDRKDRDLVFQIIFENQIYFQSVAFSYFLESQTISNDDAMLSAQEKIFRELASFKFEGKLNKEIFYYFVFHFEEILFFEFSNCTRISKNEYLDIIGNICKEKVYLNCSFFNMY